MQDNSKANTDLSYDDLYTSYKPLMFSLAYRMLGSVSDAEDVIQDVFTSLLQYNTSEIKYLKTFLSKMVTNRCINVLKSAYKRRESYAGEWLPEPIAHSITNEPLEYMERNDQISYALLVLLDKLSPMERAVFLLREIYQYEYLEIAEIVMKSETNCRKIYSRLKLKLEIPVNDLDEDTFKQEERLVKQFTLAFSEGRIDDLIQLLADDVVYVSDGGGKTKTAIFPVFSRKRVLMLLNGLHPRWFPNHFTSIINLNGHPGMLIGETSGVIALQFNSANLITKIYHVVNPEKLHHVYLE
jgi:RNA polymerase sigma factor (sigma-70 family)